MDNGAIERSSPYLKNFGPFPPSAPLHPFDWPHIGNAWLTIGPLKGAKGQAKQSGVMATWLPPTRLTERGIPG